ncbi:hypothetical protein D3C84_1303820 [compost metagenome]
MFELLNARTQRRLGHVQLGGRPAEMEFFGYNGKGLKILDIHDSVLPSSIILFCGSE